MVYESQVSSHRIWALTSTAELYSSSVQTHRGVLPDPTLHLQAGTNSTHRRSITPGIASSPFMHVRCMYPAYWFPFDLPLSPMVLWFCHGARPSLVKSAWFPAGKNCPAGKVLVEYAVDSHEPLLPISQVSQVVPDRVSLELPAPELPVHFEFEAVPNHRLFWSLLHADLLVI